MSIPVTVHLEEPQGLCVRISQMQMRPGDEVEFDLFPRTGDNKDGEDEPKRKPKSYVGMLFRLRLEFREQDKSLILKTEDESYKILSLVPVKGSKWHDDYEVKFHVIEDKCPCCGNKKK